ncbi:hypothetical protein EDC04DRAFT_2892921 [Pisolithus marmoratus]|nr:hypothetical protein EDC04DRAFT_2892921 [Pisolithus marmoratus]
MSFEGYPLAFYGKNIIEDYHASLTAKLPQLDTKEAGFFDISDDALRFFPHKKVGILGAGVGGLYTALILESLDIEFEILEASDHVGGRLSTYKFPGAQKYDYYDAGAMRYPLPKKDAQGRYKNGIMKRLAELIIYPSLNEGSDRLQDKLIPYYYKGREVSNKPKGPFRGQEIGVDVDYIKAGADAISNDVTRPWKVMKENDSYSVRGYMASKYIPSANLELPPQHLPNDVVNWCALLGASSGGYDRALTESVLSSLAFAKVGSTDFGDVDWKCFDGGSEVLPKKMAEVITRRQNRIHFGKRVTAIRRGDLIIEIPIDFPRDKLPSGVNELEMPSESDDLIADGTDIIEDPMHRKRVKIIIRGAGVEITVNNESEPRVYSHVISTLPLPVLRTIDMKGADMNVMQKNALRQLQYGPSIKIAIRFEEAWWTTKLGIVGGQSFTDLPIRTIVYPSYGVDSNTPSTVLIASYCWTSDADRLGSLAMPEQNALLKELVLRNLAEAHGGPITYEFLLNKFRDMHVKDWSRDVYSMGAFPYFGPGDFQNLYTSLTYPAVNKRLHFAGEAISTRHAWLVGALDSAWRAVHEYLSVTRQEDKMRRFKQLWGGNAEWTCPPAQFNRPQSDLLDEHLGLIHEAIPAGMIPYDG